MGLLISFCTLVHVFGQSEPNIISPQQLNGEWQIDVNASWAKLTDEAKRLLVNMDAGFTTTAKNTLKGQKFYFGLTGDLKMVNSDEKAFNGQYEITESGKAIHFVFDPQNKRSYKVVSCRESKMVLQIMESKGPVSPMVVELHLFKK